MHRKLCLLSVALSVFSCFSLIVSVYAASMWSRTYGGADSEWACSLVGTFDGGYAIAGTIEVFNRYDIWLLKTDSNGDVQWNRTYGGVGNDVASCLVATSDGGYMLAGTWNDSRYYGDGYYGDFWLLKIDASGNVQWNKTYDGGAGLDKPCSVLAMSDGGCIIAGTRNYKSAYIFNNYAGGDYWLVKTDALGNVQWNKTYGGAGNDVTCSLIATSDGGYMIAGTWNATGYYGFGNWGNPWLVKTDAQGNMLWNRSYGVAEDNSGWYAKYANSLVTTSDGGYALAGTINEMRVPWLMKIDAAGNLQWNRTYDDPMRLDASASVVVVSSGGGYTIASFTEVGITLARTDALGNLQWNREVAGGDFLWRDKGSMIATSDGGYALAAGKEDIWLMKTDSVGVVPEFSSWLIPALLLAVTTFIIIRKKKLFCTHS